MNSVSGPYIHGKNSVGRIMRLVMLALLPATFFGLYNFGWPAINLFLVTLFSAVVVEAACLRIAGKPVRSALFDGSALLSAWLLAMTLPPWSPWWIGVVGSLLAIVIGKQIFGGLGQNLFNPAMVARVALLVSFPLQMTTFLSPQPLFAAGSPGFLQGLTITFSGNRHLTDAVSGASLLGHVRTELGRGIGLTQAMPDGYNLLTMAIGNVAGSLGETSGLLLLLGGLFLLYTRVISWYIPLSLTVGLLLPAAIFHAIAPQDYPGALYHLFSGATLLGAFFIATDLVTSPSSAKGQLLFGTACGLLVFTIRTWAGYPEGMAFAVMLMNACSPLIDHYLQPRIYGRDRKGNPLHYDTDQGSA